MGRKKVKGCENILGNSRGAKISGEMGVKNIRRKVKRPENVQRKIRGTKYPKRKGY